MILNLYFQHVQTYVHLYRSKIVRLKTIIADVDKLVQLRRKNLQDALLFRSLEEKLAEIKSWCSNEGRLQPASFIHKDMTFEELKEFKDKQQQAIEVTKPILGNTHLV